MLPDVNKKRTNPLASAYQAAAPLANFRRSVSSLTMAALLFTAPYSGAAADKSTPQAPATTVKLDKKFKGKLPITELTEDEAIMHALNRLAYGPRPGDVEHVRKLGLEKWIDQQLHPESIDDSALDTRLQRYPTIDHVLRSNCSINFRNAEQGAKTTRNHQRASMKISKK